MNLDQAKYFLDEGFIVCILDCDECDALVLKEARPGDKTVHCPRCGTIFDIDEHSKLI